MRTLALALLLAIGLVGSARAQAPTGDDEATASALVEQAAHAYDQNQLDEALQLLSRAYALSPRASILYNQAQVLRAKDDCAGALDAYRRFIDATSPDDPNRERATKWRAEMQTCADQRNKPPAPVKLAVEEPARQPAPPPAVVISTPAVSDHPEPHPPGHRRLMRASGWALVGVGVVAAGVAAAYAWKAHDIQDQLNSQIAQGDVWGTTQASQDAQRSHDAAWTYWSASVAALAGAGGATLLIVSRPPAASSAETHTALLGWTGAF
jgi:tetratricopeptide (TPR) repeat protein